MGQGNRLSTNMDTTHSSATTESSEQSKASENPGATSESIETDDQSQTRTDSASKSVAEEIDGEGDELEPGLPLDQVFETLKNRRRREVLHYLDGNEGEASLSDLAEHIAAIENDTTVKAISSTQRKRVYVGLYQCHLPKMDDMDIVDFDKNRGTVELARNAEQVKSYLGEPDPIDWYKGYLGLAVAGGLLFVASQAGAAQYGLSSAVILLGVLVGMSLCAVFQAGGLDRLLSR